MYEHILAGTDGSQEARSGIRYAQSLAAHIDSDLEVLHVVDEQLLPDAESEIEEQKLLEELEGHATGGLIETAQQEAIVQSLDTTTKRGVPYRTFLDYAETSGTDLIVVGKGGSAHRRLGSTTERIMTLSSVPVLTVPKATALTEYTVTESLDTIVVPLDGANPAERAANQALQWAENVDASIHWVYVVDTTLYEFGDIPRSVIGNHRKGGEKTLDEFVAQANEDGINSTKTLLRGKPSEEIRSYVEGVEADLLAMGTRGQGGLPERLLGSTTRRTVRDSSVPVLSVS